MIVLRTFRGKEAMAIRNSGKALSSNQFPVVESFLKVKNSSEVSSQPSNSFNYVFICNHVQISNKSQIALF